MDLEFDIANISTLLGIEQSEIAKIFDMSWDTFASFLKTEDESKKEFSERLYGFAYSEGVQLNLTYEGLLVDQCSQKKEKVLFHGAKSEIEGPIDLSHSRDNNDLGQGFYLGKSYEQAAMYIASSSCPYVYAFSFVDKRLKIIHYELSEKWMIVVAYFRGLLKGYENKKIVIETLKEIEGADVIISPIADNRMYNLISRFANQELTDKQTIASLAATNLGEQYAFKTKKALGSIKLIRKMYVPKNEKKELLERREKLHISSLDKARLAQRQNLGLGRYIDQWE